MSNQHLVRGLLGVGAAAGLLACIPVPMAQPGASPGPVANGQNPLRFKTNVLQLGAGESRSLIQLLENNGQAVAPAAASVLTFRSGNPAVATVAADGTVKAVAPGATTLTVVANQNPAFGATLELTVTASGVAVQMTLDPATAVLEPGEQVALKATVQLASGATNANVDWTSSDNTIATVNPTTGVVNALKEGRVTIRAVYTPDNAYQQVADIRVVKDKKAVPSAAPSTVVFGGTSPSSTPAPGAPTPTPTPPGKWVVQRTGVTEALTDVRFLDEQTGFAVGDKGVVLKTSTGGTTWKASYPLALGYQNIERADFATADVGFAIVGRKLYRTADGGAEWTAVEGLPSVPAGTEKGATWVECFGPKTVYAIFGKHLFTSADAGATWAKVEVPLAGDEEPTSVGVYGEKVWVVGSRKVYTRLEGLGWVGVLAAGGAVAKAQFVSAEVGFLQTPSHGMRVTPVYATGDGGKTYNALSAGGVDMDWVDARRGWLVQSNQIGNGRVMTFMHATTDGGATWQPTPMEPEPVYPNGVAALDMVSPAAGWCVGGNGAVYRWQANATP